MPRTILTGILITPFILGACGGDEPQKLETLTRANIIARVDSHEISGGNYVSPSEYKDLLSAQGASWESAKTEGESLIFSALEFVNGAALDEVALSGLIILNDKAPIAERVTFKGFSNDGTVIASGAFSFPAGVAVDAYVDYVSKDGVSPDIGPEMMALAIDVLEGFDGGGYLLDIRAEDANLDFMGWTTEAGRPTFSVVGEGIEFSENEFYQIDSVKVLHINASILENMHLDGGEPNMDVIVDFYSPFEPVFESLKVTNLSVQDEEIGINIPELNWTMSPVSNGVHTNYLDFTAIYDLEDEVWSDVPVEIQEQFEDRGFLPISVAISSEAIIDRNKKRYFLKSGNVNLSDKLNFELSYEIDGVEGWIAGLVSGVLKTFQAMTIFGTGDAGIMAAGISQALMSKWENLVLNHLTLTITEQDFLDDVIEMAAQNQERSPEDIRSQMAGAIVLPTLSAQSSYQADLGLDYIEATQAFVEKGGSLRLSLRPKNGLAFLDIYKSIEMEKLSGDPDLIGLADEILKMLNMDFEHIPPN